MINKKFLIPILFIASVVVVTGVGVYLVSDKSGNDNIGEGSPKIEIIPFEFDAGDISMSAGLYTKDFKIKNTGVGDLKIDSVWTSCHCTTAVLKIGNKTSPMFGMSNNASFWSQKISPGEIAILSVIFDPAFHGPQGTGEVIRVVYLSTNDPQNKKVEIKLLANVTH